MYDFSNPVYVRKLYPFCIADIILRYLFSLEVVRAVSHSSAQGVELFIYVTAPADAH